MKLKKHERQAVAGIKLVAARHGVTARVICRGRHPCKVELTAPGWREVVGMASSPGDAHWAVRVAVDQAERACRAKPVAADEQRKQPTHHPLPHQPTDQLKSSPPSSFPSLL